ncbi:MAG: NADH-quinone oxidoreductase subunit M [Phycisphaeraceae bacterium]|nr:NADH-quinone oxidoreductase subunit M [Phycisphaerales bacterium]MCB9859527.1 NADH-quinone oxidoreductase subunit M [Phycisphaeraceae bacterium]
MSQFILPLLVLLPLAFAMMVAMAPAARAKSIALWGMLIPAGLGLAALFMFSWVGDSYQFESAIEWMPQLGLSLRMGVDSVAMLLIALTLLLGPICVVASYTAITERVKTYYSWLLVLQSAMICVFSARDLVLFYIAFEFTLIPMYVLISLYGSTNRARAATKFFLYTFTGSIIALAGLVYVVYFNATQSAGAVEGMGRWTTSIAPLLESARYMSLGEQTFVLAALILGFGVKVPIFPFHTWLPLAHTEAPTAGSVILAGVLLKLGTYGLYRFALPIAPAALAEYAPLLAVCAIIGIVYAGLICWVQTDVKKLVAYSSVAHLGFCVLGLLALNHTGIAGSVLYMINHGLSTGALFLLIGMMYERYHTRSMREVGGLYKKMPIWGAFMVFFTMASVGLPGLNGFVSEIMCLMGTFQADKAWAGSLGGAGNTLGWGYAAIAGTGMIVAAMYLLIMLGKVVWGPLVEPDSHHHHDDEHESVLPTDLSRREIGVLIPLGLLCLVVGLYPKPMLDAIRGPVDETIRMVEQGRALHQNAVPHDEHAVTPPTTHTQAPSSDPSTEEEHAS